MSGLNAVLYFILVLPGYQKYCNIMEYYGILCNTKIQKVVVVVSAAAAQLKHLSRGTIKAFSILYTTVYTTRYLIIYLSLYARREMIPSPVLRSSPFTPLVEELFLFSNLKPPPYFQVVPTA